MTDLKMAMEWLETGQYIVKHDEMSYSVRVTDFAEETDELRKVLLDALRKEPCEYCSNTNNKFPVKNRSLRRLPLSVFIESNWLCIVAKKATFSITIKRCPNCGRPLPAPPERSE